MAESDAVPSIVVRTFGELRVFVDDTEVGVGSARRQLLFARLLVARGRSVSLQQLIDSLWPDSAPGSAANQVHRYVGEIRRMLEPGLKSRELGSVILPSSNGYRVVVAGTGCDLEDFYASADEALALAKGSESARSLDAYKRALTIASQPPFLGLSTSPHQIDGIAAVDGDRMRVAVEAADVALSAHSVEILPTIEQIARGAPLNEPVQARLIRLLVAAGRRVDALALFDSTRVKLANELGVSPTTELVAAHSLALADDPASSDARLPGVRTLPPRRAGFVRTEETDNAKTDLKEALDTRSISTAIVSGMAGIGKTTLAINWAYDLSDRFTDAQLYINMRGFDSSNQAESAHSARDALLEALGENLIAFNDDSQAKQTRYRAILENRKILIVLDNVRDADQVTGLLAGASESFTIVTSRNQLPGLVVRDGAAVVSLSRWSDVESRELMASRLGRRRAQSEQGALDVLVSRCAGLPLALAIMAARVAMQPSVGLQQVAAELSTPSLAMRALAADGQENDLRTVFAWSYERLSTGAARLFRLVSVYPGSAIYEGIAASISGLSRRTVAPFLRELAGASMIIPLEGHEYAIHDLLRLYAGELITAEEEAVATHQLIGYYVQSTRNLWSAIGITPEIPLPAPPPDPIEPAEFTSSFESDSWYLHERDAIGEILDLAWRDAFYIELSVIAASVRLASQRFETLTAGLPTARKGLLAAEESGSLVHVAEASRDVGQRLGMTQTMADGTLLLERALSLFEIVRNEWGVAGCFRTLGAMAQMHDDVDAHLVYAIRGLEIAERAGSPAMLAGAVVTAGHAYIANDQWEKALSLLELGQSVTESFPLSRGDFSTLMAHALNHSGRHREAFDMTTWGSAAVDNTSWLAQGHLLQRAVAAAELGEWAALTEAAAMHERNYEEYEEVLRESNGDETIDTFNEQVRTALGKIPPS